MALSLIGWSCKLPTTNTFLDTVDGVKMFVKFIEFSSMLNGFKWTEDIL